MEMSSGGEVVMRWEKRMGKSFAQIDLTLVSLQECQLEHIIMGGKCHNQMFKLK